MKNLLLLAISLIFFNLSYTQGFETSVNPPVFILPCSDTNNSYGLKVKEFNNTYFVLSIIHVGLGDCQIIGGMGYAIYRFDQNGDTLYSNLYMHPDNNSNSTGSYRATDFVIGSDSSIYVLGTEEYGVVPIDPVFIAKFDVTGSLIWKQNYPSSYLTPQTIAIDDSLLFIGGYKSTGSSTFTAAVLQLDTAGIVEWSGYSQNGNFTKINEIIKRNNDFVLVGYNIPIGTSTNNYMPFIVPFTANWIDPVSHYFGNPNHTYPWVDAIYNHDDHIILAGHSSLYGTVHLFEIDDNNAMLDMTVLEPDNQIEVYYFKCLSETPDSNYVLVGERIYFDDFNSGYGRTTIYEKFDQSGFIVQEREYAGNSDDMLTDQNGNIVVVGTRYNQEMGHVWDRTTYLMRTNEYGYTDDCEPKFVLNYYNAYLTDSIPFGGVVHIYNNSEGEASNFHWEFNGNIGWLYGHNESYVSNQSGWNVIELIGCGQVYVDSIYIIPQTQGIDELPSFNLTIYPNPSTNIFQIITDLSGQISIFDLNGKLVYSDIYFKGEMINAETWSKGMYSIEFQTDSGIYRTKFIKG